MFSRDVVGLFGALVMMGWLVLAIVTGSRLRRRLLQLPARERRAPALKWGLGIGGGFGLLLWLSGLVWSRVADVEQAWTVLLGDAAGNLIIGLMSGSVLAWAMLDTLRRGDRH